MRGSIDSAFGYDEGSVMVKLGREEPAMSMDTSGKIIWAKHSEVQQANLKNLAGGWSPKLLTIIARTLQWVEPKIINSYKKKVELPLSRTSHRL